MEQNKLKNIIEAALMAVDEPLSVERIQAIFDPNMEEVPNKETVRNVVSLLQNDYQERGIEIREVASGYRVQVVSTYAEWINRLWEDRPPKYSRALLETLAIIAYRQPVTRGEIEDIRGVSVSTNIVKILLEREWVRVAGHRDVPGRPSVYVTTRQFLDYFNLKGLADLPELPELRDLDEISPDLFASQAGHIGGQEAPLRVVGSNSDQDSEPAEAQAGNDDTDSGTADDADPDDEQDSIIGQQAGQLVDADDESSVEHEASDQAQSDATDVEVTDAISDEDENPSSDQQGFA
jgi:segregation and condensation protein B